MRLFIDDEYLDPGAEGLGAHVLGSVPEFVRVRPDWPSFYLYRYIWDIIGQKR